MIVKTVKITSKGQISLPVEIRKSVGISEGEDLIIIQEGNKILLEKTEDMVKDDFRDMLRHSERVAHTLWSNKDDEIWDTV